MAERKRGQAAGRVGAWRNVNRVQLAALFGVHEDTVTEYARNGMPMLARGGAGKEGSYDAVACLNWWRQHFGRNAKELAQTRALEASAALNEAKLAEAVGELLPRTVVVQAGQTFVKGWVAMLRALPRQARQAGYLTTDQQENAIAALIRTVLDDIARWSTLADVKRSTRKADAA